MFRIATLVITAFMCIYSLPAFSQGTKTPAYPPYIQLLADQGAQVRYIGKGLGLDTWLTAMNGRVQYIYVTPNQEANIVGVLLDRNGQLITSQQVAAFAESDPESFKSFASAAVPGLKKAIVEQGANAPDIPQEKQSENVTPEKFAATLGVAKADSPAEKLYADLEGANWFEVGEDNAPMFYAVIDPDCSHCHRLIQTLREREAFKNGEVSARLVPVGLMSGDALYRAGTLLSLPNKQEVLFSHIDGDENALPVDKEATLSGVSKNMALLQKWNLDVTPFLVYRAGNGDLKIVRGVPKDMDAFLKDIAKNS